MPSFGLSKDEFQSQTARLMYDELFNSKMDCQPKTEGEVKSKKTDVNIKDMAQEDKIQVNNPPLQTQSKISIDTIVSEITEQEKSKKPFEIPKGKPPSLMDFDVLYFERFFGIVGDKQAKYRTILNIINNTSMIYLGPSSGGKSAIQDASRELLNDVSITLNDPSDVDDALMSKNTNGKAWFSPELQILLRSSRNQKDILKLLSNHESYKGMRIAFFVTAAAYENEYFQKFIIPNKELMRRLDIIDVECSFEKVKTIRESMNKKRMQGALLEQSDEFTKEYFKEWLAYWRNLKLDSVIDPCCAFHDQYFILSFKSFDPIKRYHKLEDALLKMKLEENTYQLNGKAIRILSIREKYRADSFRKNINQTLEKIDDPETIKKYYGWSDEELKAYQKSVEKSREDVDWQACWESGLESLKHAQQKGLLPASLISEYINRHVINGKITVVDDYTGEEVLLAEHPRTKPAERNVIVITDLERVVDEPVDGSQESYKPMQHRIILPAKQQLCLPPGGYNGTSNSREN